LFITSFRGAEGLQDIHLDINCKGGRKNAN
jgi:hypothetical protein